MSIEEHLAGLREHHARQAVATQGQQAEEEREDDSTMRQTRGNVVAIIRLAEQFARWANRTGYESDFKTGFRGRKQGWELKSGFVVYTTGEVEYTKHAGAKYADDATRAYLEKTPYEDIEWAVAKIVHESGKPWP